MVVVVVGGRFILTSNQVYLHVWRLTNISEAHLFQGSCRVLVYISVTLEKVKKKKKKINKQPSLRNGVSHEGEGRARSHVGTDAARTAAEHDGLKFF